MMRSMAYPALEPAVDLAPEDCAGLLERHDPAGDPADDGSAWMPALRAFFARYAEGVRTFDPTIVVGAYAEQYVSASPDGAICARNDAAFRAAFAPWRARFEAMGFRTTVIRSLETTPLDAHFSLARVGWRTRFDRGAGPVDVDFDESYVLLRRDGDVAPQIVCAISHRTEADSLRAAGLL
jgi:hypothetical protein